MSFCTAVSQKQDLFLRQTEIEISLYKVSDLQMSEEICPWQPVLLLKLLKSCKSTLDAYITNTAEL